MSHYISYIMNTETTVLTPKTNANQLGLLNEEIHKSVLDIFDWSSVDESIDGSRYS